MLAADLAPAFVYTVVGVLGALFGSFFNVAIYRWPRGMSVVTPPSHCPSCGAAIPPWRNLPILGYFMLRGRTACCGTRLSPRYVLVETLTAALALALARRFWVDAPLGTSLAQAAFETAVYFAFVGGLVVATFVDLEWMEIPDEVSLPGSALGLATAPLRLAPGAAAAAYGAGLGFLLVQVFFVWTYERLFGRRGMGEGDSKLLMMIGAFLGWKAVLFALIAGSMQGLVAAAVSLATGRGRAGSTDDDSPVPAEAEPAVAPGVPHAAGLPANPHESDAALATDRHVALSDIETLRPSGLRGVARLRIPFGPFLALGALEYLFFGPELVRWYFDLFARLAP